MESLADWLKREQVPGITGIDTRELTKVLREHGVMMGKIVFDDEPDSVPEAQYAGVNYVDKVSCKEVIRYNEGNGRKKVVLVDCGVKSNIIRCLLKRDVEVIRVPWDYDFNGMEFDGLSSPTDRVTLIRAMLPCRTSSRRCGMRNFLSLVFVWVTSCFRRQEERRFIS